MHVAYQVRYENAEKDKFIWCFMRMNITVQKYVYY